ncbi:MAG: RNA pseudouridine synthase [Clostridia bacterium]|nr:RNA pseudouridine synthase [Clostridia bacterium]
MTDSRFEILYEDNHLIGVVKPSGILSQSDGSGSADMLTLLSSDIARRFGKPGKAFVGLIHRLDRNVGGAMFFAKTSKGASRASEDMRTGNFYKGYFALTEKRICGPDEGFLRDRLKKDERQNRVFRSDEGRECVLYYKYICAVPCEAVSERITVNESELSVRSERFIYFAVPVTGRSHQIRAQFSLAGAPLCGDNKYGPLSSDAARNKRDAAGVSDPDIGLWSVIASVRKTVMRQERIWVSSLPRGKKWLLSDGTFPLAAADFIRAPETRSLLENLKGETFGETV